MSMSGVLTFATWVMARARREVRRVLPRARRGTSSGVNWREVGGVPEAAQSAIERCETAAAKRSVWVMAQFVSTPPPLPPVTPRRVRVHVAAADQLVHARHQVLVVVARVAVLDDVAEVLAVGRAAARVRVEHHVALGRHPLHLVEERVAVGGVRPAVDVQDQRVAPRRDRSPAASGPGPGSACRRSSGTRSPPAAVRSSSAKSAAFTRVRRRGGRRRGSRRRPRRGRRSRSAWRRARPGATPSALAEKDITSWSPAVTSWSRPDGEVEALQVGAPLLGGDEEQAAPVLRPGDGLRSPAAGRALVAGEPRPRRSRGPRSGSAAAPPRRPPRTGPAGRRSAAACR